LKHRRYESFLVVQLVDDAIVKSENEKIESLIKFSKAYNKYSCTRIKRVVMMMSKYICIMTLMPADLNKRSIEIGAVERDSLK